MAARDAACAGFYPSRLSATTMTLTRRSWTASCPSCRQTHWSLTWLCWLMFHPYWMCASTGDRPCCSSSHLLALFSRVVNCAHVSAAGCKRMPQELISLCEQISIDNKQCGLLEMVRTQLPVLLCASAAPLLRYLPSSTLWFSPSCSPRRACTAAHTRCAPTASCAHTPSHAMCTR